MNFVFDLSARQVMKDFNKVLTSAIDTDSFFLVCIACSASIPMIDDLNAR